LACASLFFFFSACGNQHSNQIPITVTYSQGFAPPSSMIVNQTCGIAATVANDPKFAGVNWACTPTSQCGSFTPITTQSTVPTTYTAPAGVPPGNNVSITATSVADPSKSATSTILITLDTSTCLQ
jgi:hypothetical protein